MSYMDFVNTTVSRLDADLLAELKVMLVDEYIPFSVMLEQEITCPVLCEKICDYFEKVELKTGRNFEKLVDKYTSDLDSVIESRIAKEPKPKKGVPTPAMPRARKYYNKAMTIQKTNKITKHGLLDYSRLMLCLYMAIVNNGLKEIDDFDLATESLNLTRILESLRKEKAPHGRKLRFDTKDLYDPDRSTFIITIIMFYYIKSKEIVGEF